MGIQGKLDQHLKFILLYYWKEIGASIKQHKFTSNIFLSSYCCDTCTTAVVNYLFLDHISHNLRYTQR